LGKWERPVEEKGRRRDWKSGKDLEGSWSLGPKQDPLEMLRGSPILLKEGKEISKSSQSSYKASSDSELRTS
jgi:hypothetical protein